MNTTLLLITVFAVAVAVAAIIVVFLAYREERRRSEARIAALREMTGMEDAAADFAAAPIELDELPTYEADSADSSSRVMFGESNAASPWGRRLAAAVATALIAAAAGYVLIPRSGSPAPESRASAAQALPLELLSLRHSHEDGRLVVTGLVQNPRAGTPLNRVIATAFLFGADGTFLASGRAPLDFSTLAPGDESPFVVAVPVTGTVARYRVGFRGEDGRVIAHVDRRVASTLARNPS